MDFAQQQRNPAKHLVGITFVIVLHILIVYALITGLARTAVEAIRQPFETKLIEEIKPEDKPPPPPPPKLAAPPPPFIPAPEINIAVPVASTGPTITVTRTPPPVAPPPPVATVRTAPVIDARRSCPTPEYPAASRRLEESGTVTLMFLIGTDGRVQESRVDASSGFPRLDEAARAALSRCRFKPGTVNGQPEASWAPIRYTWKLQ